VIRAARLALLLACVACAGPRVKAPTATRDPGRPPDLTGVQVLFLPVQRSPLPGSATTAARYDGVDLLDAEISYWLREQAPDVRWVLPETIDRTLRRTPELDIKVRQLDVAVFRRAQVKRIGDPLYGDLRRIAAVLDAKLAVVPVGAEFKPGDATQGRLEIALAIIDLSFGDVIWFGVLGGDAGTPGQQTAASTAQAVASRFGRSRNQ
jgi:hypothetical protein